MTEHKGGPPLNDTYPKFVWRKAKREAKKEELSYQEYCNKYRLNRELSSI